MTRPNLVALSLDSHRGLEPLLPGGTVALGFFDGCHLGHQKILSLCRERGGENSAILTFPEHPGAVIPGRQAPDLITTTQERIELLAQYGRFVFLKTFDRDFSAWSAERFVSELLVNQLAVGDVVVGHDYRFGHRAVGDVDRLTALGASLGFSVVVVPPVVSAHSEPLIISSTKVRQAIAEGELRLAAQLLGRPYSLNSRVVKGLQRGRTIDFPTANMSFPIGKIQPPHGVMAVRALLSDGRTQLGVANFGLRPTVEEKAVRPLLEVHLFDFNEDLYGQDMVVELVSFLREEQKFESFSELKSQIVRDAEQARIVLGT